MVEVTNGATEPAHFGPVGDAARRVASYCDGSARAHVYTAAFAALAAKESELAAERAKVEKLRAQVEADRDTFRDIDILDDPIGAAAICEAGFRNCTAALKAKENSNG